MSCHVSDEDFQAFMAGDSDDLVDHVESCEWCQTRMEEAWSEDTTQVTEQIMRAVRLESFGRNIAEALIDVGSRYGRAVAVYVAKVDA